jgi:hypothetical protein
VVAGVGVSEKDFGIPSTTHDAPFGGGWVVVSTASAAATLSLPLSLLDSCATSIKTSPHRCGCAVANSRVLPSLTVHPPSSHSSP